MKTVEFKISRKKTSFLMIAGIFFVIASFLFLFFPHIFKSFLMGNLFLIRIIGFIGFLFFGFGSIVLIKKVFFGKNMGIIINENGIVDNSSYASVGLIEWKDIKAIRKSGVASTDFLLIDVNNPEKYINNKSKVKQKMLNMSYNSYGTPISISSNFVDCDFNVLEETINNAFLEYKKSNI